MICLEEDDGETVMQSGWCYGLCDRTGKKGDFPAECVYVLPAITKPSAYVLVRIMSVLFDPLSLVPVDMHSSLHNLRCYAERAVATLCIRLISTSSL